MSINDVEKHSAHSAEARRRIALTAVLDESASTRAEREQVAILAGVRSHMWLAAGIGRAASAAFLDALCLEFRITTVLAAGIVMCQTQPMGPKSWLRHKCMGYGNSD